MGFLTARA
jgi:hypothetical protein